MSELEQEKLNRKEEFQRLCREIITSSLQLGHSPDVIKKKLSKGWFIVPPPTAQFVLHGVRTRSQLK